MIRKIQDFVQLILINGDSPYIPLQSIVSDKLDNDFGIKFKKYGNFLYFKGIRYSLNHSRIVEYNIDFYSNSNLKFKIINNPNLKVINKFTYLHQILHLLKILKINYKEIKIKDIDYFIIQTENQVNIYFDLETGYLFRIGQQIKELNF